MRFQHSYRSHLIVALIAFSIGLLTAKSADRPRFAPAPVPTPPAASQPRAAYPAASPGPPQLDARVRQQLERLTKAADIVLDRIQNEEADLYMRIQYFEKPDRLDPNSYASKDEVGQWQANLQVLQDKSDLVGQLYANLQKNLEGELRSAGANEEITSRFINVVIAGFPWPTIEKKKQLLNRYIDQHGKLLSLYKKNWGLWKPTSTGNKPQFDSTTTTSMYTKLRDEIVSTGTELDKTYKEMTE
ncbi:MAG: hypothetical protein JO076_05400 [Verrucomicrobia bacterium]|nr:hypothetical protein [Verrucomicrobiota bacterium]